MIIKKKKLIICSVFATFALLSIQQASGIRHTAKIISNISKALGAQFSQYSHGPSLKQTFINEQQGIIPFTEIDKAVSNVCINGYFQIQDVPEQLRYSRNKKTLTLAYKGLQIILGKHCPNFFDIDPYSRQELTHTALIYSDKQTIEALAQITQGKEFYIDFLVKDIEV